MLEDFPGSYSSQLLETMARSGTGTAPAYLLLILAFLPSRESQPGLRLGEHDPGSVGRAQVGWDCGCGEAILDLVGSDESPFR